MPKARFAVLDHGRGIAPADIEQTFGKYMQIDRMSCGVGLGLYISRSLARANGGDITMNAERARGK